MGDTVVGDTILFQFNWKAYGTGTTPEFDIACRLDGQPFYSERRTAVIGSQQQIWEVTFSDPWVVTEGEHTVAWFIDASREIDESDEENNDTLLVFTPDYPNVPPWIHITHPDYGDTTNSTFLITWEDEDPDDNALISLYWDDDSLGYDGNPIAGAALIEEDDTTDSFLWDLNGYATGIYWVWAYMNDDETFVQVYSDGPLYYDPDWVSVQPAPWTAQISNFRLESVYPNPFNSSTRVRFLMPQADRVTLKVYDSMGRLCAEPFAGFLSPGIHDLSWSPGELPSGMYLLEISTSEQQSRAKALFLK